MGRSIRFAALRLACYTDGAIRSDADRHKLTKEIDCRAPEFRLRVTIMRLERQSIAPNQQQIVRCSLTASSVGVDVIKIGDN